MKESKLAIGVLFFCLVVVLPGFRRPAFGLKTAEVHGRVVDAEGKPVAGADVLIYDSENVRRPADFTAARTGSDGLYRVTLPPGKYWMVAVFRANGARFGPLGLKDKHSGDPLPVQAEAGSPQRVDFTVRDLREAALLYHKQNKHLLTFSGKIVDGHGRPCPLVYVAADPNIAAVAIPRYISAWTDRDGRFSLYLPAGEYQLAVADAFPPQHFLAPPVRVKVEKAINNFKIRVPGQ